MQFDDYQQEVIENRYTTWLNSSELDYLISDLHSLALKANDLGYSLDVIAQRGLEKLKK